MSGIQRSTEIPSLPTLVEGGVSGAVYTTWMGVMAPMGTPPMVIQEINKAFAIVLANSEVRAKLQSSGWSIKADGVNSDQAVQLIKKNLELYRPIVESARMTFD